MLLQIYRAGGSTVICYPLLFETSDFYLCQDMRLVLDDVKVVHALCRGTIHASSACSLCFSPNACTAIALALVHMLVVATDASVRVSKNVSGWPTQMYDSLSHVAACNRILSTPLQFCQLPHCQSKLLA